MDSTTMIMILVIFNLFLMQQCAQCASNEDDRDSPPTSSRLRRLIGKKDKRSASCRNEDKNEEVQTGSSSLHGTVSLGKGKKLESSSDVMVNKSSSNKEKIIWTNKLNKDVLYFFYKHSDRRRKQKYLKIDQDRFVQDFINHYGLIDGDELIERAKYLRKNMIEKFSTLPGDVSLSVAKKYHDALLRSYMRSRGGEKSTRKNKFQKEWMEEMKDEPQLAHANVDELITQAKTLLKSMKKYEPPTQTTGSEEEQILSEQRNQQPQYHQAMRQEYAVGQYDQYNQEFVRTPHSGSMYHHFLPSHIPQTDYSNYGGMAGSSHSRDSSQHDLNLDLSLDLRNTRGESPNTNLTLEYPPYDDSPR